MSALTPYDTGAALEPVPYVLPTPNYAPGSEKFGYVDFDDDESTTRFTVWSEHHDDGSYTLHIYGSNADTTYHIHENGGPTLD